MVGALLDVTPCTVVAAQDLLAIIGGSGGSSFSQVCPNGQVLTGIRARRGMTLDAIGIRCKPVRADGALGSESDQGPVWGGPGGTPFAQSCSPGYVVAEQVAVFNGAVLTELTYLCYRWLSATGSWDRMDNGVPIRVLPANVAPGARINGSSTRCQFAARPADGVRGRSGLVVDAIGIRCDAP